MTETQRVTVRHEGCLGCGSGCLPALVVVGVLALAYEYWYVTVPVAVVALGVYLYINRDRLHAIGAEPAAAPETQTEAVAEGGRWEPDPLSPDTTERWRQGDEWTGATRPRA